MRSINIWLVIGSVLLVSGAHSQENNTHSPLSSSVRVELPLGNIQISYVESDEGMVLDLYCRGTSVRSQRFYLGDGHVAVKVEASPRGFLAPNGLINAALLEIKEGSTIMLPKAKYEKWGAQPREVYVQTESVKFEVQKD